MHERHGTIRIPIDIQAGGGGQPYRVGSDGRREPAAAQRFERIGDDLAVGDYLLNPLTTELHRVLGVEPLVIETKGGGREISLEAARIALLVVR